MKPSKINEVDAFQVLEPLLYEPMLARSLRIIDILNGCMYHCGTCYVNSQIPSLRSSEDSIDRLLGNSYFLLMLYPGHIRLGSSGDALNHPKGVSIINKFLDATKYIGWSDDPYVIKVFTNFRDYKATELDALLELGIKYEKRLQIVISLPLNETDKVSIDFANYLRARPELFMQDFHVDKDGLFVGDLKVKAKGLDIGLNDVRHPTKWLDMGGRSLSREKLKGRIPTCDMRGTLESDKIQERGLIDTFFNPEGLWLVSYATGFESPTAKVHTLLDNRKLGLLSDMKWHPDFSTPPLWPGGKGERKDQYEAWAIEAIMQNAIRRPMTVPIQNR